MKTNLLFTYASEGYYLFMVGDSRVKMFSEKIKDLISVYYPSGYKPNKRELTSEQQRRLFDFCMKYKGFYLSAFPEFTKADAVDGICLVRTWRACKIFMKTE